MNPATQSKAMVDPDLAEVRDMVQACIQCGTCTASCPNEFAMDATPRRLWRMVLMGRQKAVFASRTFSLCSSCYYCTLRCPRGLPLTEAMAALKRAAARQGLKSCRAGIHFSRAFVDSVRRHGRLREMEFMALYLARMKSPLLPLRFAPLGLKLMGKGKVPLQLPSRGRGKLEALFTKVETLELRARAKTISPFMHPGFWPSSSDRRLQKPRKSSLFLRFCSLRSNKSDPNPGA